MGTRIFNDLDDDDIDMSEFVEPKRFLCGDGFCGQLDCSRCFPWGQNDEDDPVIDLLN
jgi:hypothetical protein